MKKLSVLFLSALLLLSLAGCGGDDSSSVIVITDPEHSSSPSFSDNTSSLLPDESTSQEYNRFVPVQGEYYYDLESVVLYLEYYGTLPDNYITKNEARDLGWEGGSVERYLEGAAIGGDYFGNREGLLPEEGGREYTECDLNTDGENSRDSERLVFSDDGLYFHTEDHYDSFTQVWVEDGEVVWE